MLLLGPPRSSSPFPSLPPKSPQSTSSKLARGALLLLLSSLDLLGAGAGQSTPVTVVVNPDSELGKEDF